MTGGTEREEGGGAKDLVPGERSQAKQGLLYYNYSLMHSQQDEGAIRLWALRCHRKRTWRYTPSSV